MKSDHQTVPASSMELANRASAGDMEAFRQLYDECFEHVAGAIHRLVGPGDDLEDLIQEAFVRIHAGLSEFRGESAFGTWAYQIARNTAIDYIRKRARTTKLEDWRPLRLSSSEWSRLEARSVLRVLYCALDQIPEESREAFVMHEIEGWKLREIAELTDTPLHTVAARVRRTREKLQKIVEVHVPEVTR